jgi:hypothetical protein
VSESFRRPRVKLGVVTIQREANMAPDISEGIFSWQSVLGAAVPPRDPDDDEDEEDEEDGGDEEEPAVIREPDEE